MSFLLGEGGGGGGVLVFVCTSDLGFQEFDSSIFLRNSRWNLLGARGLSGGGNVVCGETHFLRGSVFYRWSWRPNRDWVSEVA